MSTNVVINNTYPIAEGHPINNGNDEEEEAEMVVVDLGGTNNTAVDNTTREQQRKNQLTALHVQHQYRTIDEVQRRNWW